MIQTKRIYDTPAKTDGLRVLIDRLWPRGMSKEKAHVDLWLKEVAPSTALRTWFGHKPERFQQFRERYREELDGNTAVHELQEIAQNEPTVTLLFAAKDPTINHAIVLQEFLERKPKDATKDNGY